jgi:hypothetical protein
LPPDRKCLNCGRMFKSTKSSIEFCGKVCFAVYRWGKRSDFSTATWLAKICVVCGTEFRVWRSEAIKGKGLYCSRACYSAAHQAEKQKEAAIERWRRHSGWKEFSTQLIIDRGCACEFCGCTTGHICVHHIANPNAARSTALLLDPKNCQVLCRGCHSRTHAGTLGTHEGKNEYAPKTHLARPEFSRNCPICGNLFLVKDSRVKTCSGHCGAILRNKTVYEQPK